MTLGPRPGSGLPGSGLPGDGLPDDTPVFVISVAAQLAGMHPQTLRQYDRLGLVTPGRTPGGGRRYSERDVLLLREVQQMSQDEGINLAGVKRIMQLEHQVDALRRRIAELSAELAASQVEAQRQAARVRATRRELMPFEQTQVVVWRESGPLGR